MKKPRAPTSLTYRDAGVDIDAGNEAVRRIKESGGLYEADGAWWLRPLAGRPHTYRKRSRAWPAARRRRFSISSPFLPAMKLSSVGSGWLAKSSASCFISYGKIGAEGWIGVTTAKPRVYLSPILSPISGTIA